MNKENMRTYFFYATGTLLIYFALQNLGRIGQWLTVLLRILSPFIGGGVLAFVLFPLFCAMRRLLRHGCRVTNARALSALALLLTYLLLFALVFTLFLFVIPQLSESVTLFVQNFESYFQNFKAGVAGVSNWLGFDIWTGLEVEERLYSFVETLPKLIAAFFPEIVSFTTGAVSTVANIFLGIVLSAYILLDRERLGRQFRRICRLLLPEKINDKLFDLLELVGKTFSNFITGQLTDAAILGLLCFLGMSLLRLEYAFLISTIVAVTNLIPIVGPLVGSIPAAFILLLINPLHALWFIVFIIALQQFESHIIYPRIVGNSIGLPAIGVITAIILGGGLFGVTGMLLGIPVLSILYELSGRWLLHREERLG